MSRSENVWDKGRIGLHPLTPATSRSLTWERLVESTTNKPKVSQGSTVRNVAKKSVDGARGVLRFT